MARQKIESKDNSRVKLARKAREGRDDERVFIEGLRLAEEALRSPIEIEFALVREGFTDSERAARLIERIEGRAIEMLEVKSAVFDTVAETRSPQGIVLIGRRPTADAENFLEQLSERASKLNIIIFLDTINNPSNLGAVVRTGEAAGVRGLVTTIGSADVYAPAAIRASMGSAFRIPIWQNANPYDLLSWAAKNHYRTTSTAGDASLSYAEVDWDLPRILLFGSEAHGLNAAIAAKSNELISIPMEGNVESLNIAVAAGVILFEAKRQISAASAAEKLRSSSDSRSLRQPE
jgi:TrmH family RNA methyltransferase